MRCIDLRLGGAFLLSVTLHAVVLGYLRPAWDEARRGERQGILNATLRTVAAADPRDERQALVPLPATLSVTTPMPPRESRVTSPLAVRNHQAPNKGGIEADPAAIPASGKLSALLVIDASGHVGPIYWKQLPAMTDEAFKRLEQRLRQKAYPPSGMEYTVLEPLEDLIENDARVK